MEKQIKENLKRLRVQYVLFWLLPILLVAGYETDLLTVGRFADDGGMQYILETVGILITIALIPASLKLFSIALKKQIDQVTFPVALERYQLWNAIRLGILETAVIFNLVVYYLTLGNIGGLCALIALTASLFCMPGKKRLREELNIYKEEI